MNLQNESYEELQKRKKEKIKEWLDFLTNNEMDDILWKYRNNSFITGLVNIIYEMKKIKNDSTINKQDELLKMVGQYRDEANREKMYEIIKQLNDLEIEDEDNEEIINSLVNKIENLEDNTEFTISSLTENEQIKIGIALKAIEKAKDKGINIKSIFEIDGQSENYVGLPQNIPYVKNPKKKG